MPTLDDLLSDPNAQIELIVQGYYLNELGTLFTEWVSQTGWDDQISGPVAAYIPPLLTINLRINSQIDPLDLISSLDAFGNIEISNNHLDYAGRYDSWWRYSVDGQSWNIYAVGILSDGTRVEISDVIDTPLFSLQGINIPEVGSDTCLIRCKDQHDLDIALQPVTYSPPALYFPGTVAGVINLGDNLDITGVQSLSTWVYIEDPVTTTQYILYKDGTTTGYYLAIGLVGAGTIAAGVEITIRGQSPSTTTTAANVLRAYRWHRIDISIDTTTRRIDIDGVTAITTTSITGTPLANAVSLEIGRSFKGRIHRVLYWSDARSNATMSAEGRTPITGAETNLREAFLFSVGQGSIVASSKIGSVITGTIHNTILWDNASWHYESILGQYEPYVLGTVPRVPVTWIDPPKQIGQVSRGPIALLSELQSNHTIVSTANYTVNRSNGTLTVTVGALSGTYSATVTANNLWNSALLLDGIASRATAAFTMPAGSKYLGAHFRCDNIAITQRIIAQWPGASGHRFFLIMNAGGTNILSAIVTNDAGTAYTASIQIVKGIRYSAIASLDTVNPTTGLKLYLNGELSATTAIAGAFTGTQPTLSVGHRTSGPDLFFTGVIDELIIGNIACTLAMAQLFHSLPSTSAFPGIVAGWHLDDVPGSATAAPFVGAVSLALTSVGWTAGRSAPVDLSRSILYSRGYVEADLDPTSWLTALNDNLADCGWFVSGGAKAIDILNVILGALGFVIYLDLATSSLLKIKRFEGVSGIATETLDVDIDIQSQPIEALAVNSAIYLWTINFATNNSKQDQANIAGGLASTDPDRYQYGASAHKSVSRSDGSILERFPDARSRTRTTALLNMIDAENEAVRLLSIHRHGADRKSLQAFLSVGGIEIMEEIGPLTEECGLDTSNLIVTGISIEDGVGTITVWRPAI